MKLRPAFVVSLLLFIAVVTPARDKPWKEVRSPHFTVFTNGSLRDARQVAYEFEQLRHVIAKQYPKFRFGSDAPLLIFGAKDEDTAEALSPNLKTMKGGDQVTGEYAPGLETQYAMVRLDYERELGEEENFEGYAQSIVDINFVGLPLWVNEGMAEFLGSIEFRGHTVGIGAPPFFLRYLGEIGGVFTQVPTVKAFTPIPIETLMGARSPDFEGANGVDMFFAESWALVDYMMFGKGMEHGKRFSQFLDLVQGGIDQKKAFHQVFGQFKQMDKALDVYMHRRDFPIYGLTVAPDIDKKAFATRTLTMAETDAQLAGFHLWTRDLDGARPLVEQALTENPRLGLAHEENGYLLFSQGKRAEAEKGFSRAYALNRKLYLALFAKTMLSPEATSSSVADEAEFEQALRKVLRINPQFAPPYVQLAILSVRRNRLQDAFDYSRRAERLDPWQVAYHLLTGEILLRAGNGADAAKYAKFIADRWKGLYQEDAARLWNRIPASKRPPGTTLSPKVPKNTKVISGILASSTCNKSAKEPTMVLMHNGMPLTFRATKAGFKYTLAAGIWYGYDHLTFCHNLSGTPVVIRYTPPSKPGYAGNIVEMEIGRDLPPAAASPKQSSARANNP